MTKPIIHRTADDGQSSREQLRDQLEREFVAIHMRRQFVRRVTHVSTIALLGGIIVLGFVLRQSWQTNSTDLTAARSHSGDWNAAQRGTGNSSIEPAATSKYSAIHVTELSDAELRSLLKSTQAKWFVAEINGQPTAFPMN